jgi:hypothetical protein
MKIARDRLKLLARLADLPNDAALVAALDISHSRWANWLAGYNVPTNEAAKMLTLIPGLDLDWLYFGRQEGLSGQILKRLDALKSRRASPYSVNDQAPPTPSRGRKAIAN